MIVHDSLVRAAMDACCVGGSMIPEKWETGFPMIMLKQSSPDETQRRTAKSCGSGAATLALRRR